MPSLYIVRGASMEPALRDGDLLLVVRGGGIPARGRVAIVSVPSEDGPASRVKRVVGLPGERIAFEEGMLFIDGAHHTEPYLRGLPAHPRMDSLSWDVGQRHCFALGDNRAHSADSRSFGPIHRDAIVGIVAARLWPLFRRR